MSTLNTVNITNGTDSITVEGAVKGSAKAWVNFNGTGVVAIRASYNVSSITDNGTGDYTVNFTTAMPDANYEVNGSVSANASGTLTGLNIKTGTTPTTSAISVTTLTGGGTNQDYTYVNVAIFR